MGMGGDTTDAAAQLATLRHFVTVALDGSAKTPTFDTYRGASGSDLYNQWSGDISLGSLTANTEYTLSIEVTSKNASSSNYYIFLEHVRLYRTA